MHDQQGPDIISFLPKLSFRRRIRLLRRLLHEPRSEWMDRMLARSEIKAPSPKAEVKPDIVP